jgi:hypothetical protein
MFAPGKEGDKHTPNDEPGCTSRPYSPGINLQDEEPSRIRLLRPFLTGLLVVISDWLRYNACYAFSTEGWGS